MTADKEPLVISFQRMAPVLLLLLVVACAKPTPTPTPKWTLEYLPNGPCHVWVLSNKFRGGDSIGYVVIKSKGWTVEHGPKNGNADIFQGEDFSGALPLGFATLHDDSNGYDLSVDVVYRTDSDSAARDWTNNACGTR
jgi:hypothetical protein